MTKSVRRIIMNRRVVLIAAISTLMILALTILGFIISDYNEKTSYEDLKDYQNEVLEILNERVGDYDEKSIVLYDTNEREAKELADRLGARLRINKSGNFATLTLTDESTILDVFSNDENLDILKHLSADWSAEISESEEYERTPKSPNYNVTDNLYPYQGYIDYLNIGDAWLSYNGSGITVAVIDTGIDTDHPEFAGRISEYSYNASEDKIVKDYRTGSGSYDWSLIEDEQGHGTAVAGTLGAAMNGKGTVGIAPNVTIVVIKAECDEHGNFRRSSDLVFGLYYAIERDVDVVNMSFGSSRENIYEDAARLGRDSDILMVAAAGNNGTATPIYPAADENVIGVGALADNSWELAEYSTYGESVDIVSPGTVYTTTIGGEYKIINGTSFSSPLVAASLALMKSNYTYRYATNAEIIEILYASAYDLGDLGPDYFFGYGAIDVDALIHGTRGVITFDYLTDEIDETEQVFISGNPLQNIPEPERLYSIFDGWYYDIECTEPLELYRDTFKSDLTLYAKWVNEDDGIPYTYVILDDGTVEIRSYTGHRKYITVPEIIDNRIVSSIGDFAFKSQSKLREVQLPDTINHIGLSAFEGCSNLITVNIPDNVAEIENYAFKDDIRLSYVVIGESSKLKSIGDFAFQACFKLKTIDLPKTIVSVNGSAFLGAGSLRKINVDKENAMFSSTSGILFNKTKTELVAYPASLTEAYSIPEITHTIGKYAFAYSAVSSIDLNNIRTVGDYAFTYSGIEEIVIPNSVTNLGVNAFASCTNLSTVNIGTGLTDISCSAFISTTSLKYVEIPKNIMNIGASAFADSGLSEIVFAEDGKLATIGEEAFSSTLVEKISIPKSVSKIGSGAFSQCYNLNQVTFANGISLQSIGAQAFAETISLTEIAFPESIRIIGDRAFDGSGISGTVTIPASVEKLGAGAFASCHKLTDFAVATQNSVYVAYNGVVYTKDGKTVVVYPAGNISTEYSLRSGTKTVGASAFEGSKNLKKVKITDGVTSISDFGFYKCEDVTGYTLPSTLEEIGQYAFAENHSLASVTIPDNVIGIGSYAFAFDDKLRTITISDSTKMSRIGFAAFAFTGVTSFRVPANISSIAQYAFEGCEELQTVTFARNSKLESISAYMFIGADNINSIKFEEGSALASIQAHGFEGMAKLRAVDFGNAKLTNIDNYAFRYCSSLKGLILPETLENIGRYAFYKCSSLSTLSIPVATEHIGAYAFYGSNNCNLYFASDYLPMYLDEHWDNGLGGYFTGVKRVVTNGNWKYAEKTNGNIAIIKYLGSDTVVNLNNVALGGKIDSIGGYAFEGCGITSITLPDSLIEIQRYAFAGTKNLTKVTLPKNLKYIASYAFANSAVQSVSFAGNNVEVIEKYAFAYTDNLVSITLPSSIKTLGSYVFYESGLTSLTFAKGFSLTEIPESAFAGTSISSVVIPDSVTRIRSSAFRDNMNLKSVTLGSGDDLRIDANVFYNTGIDTLYIPDNVRYIGEYALIGLVGLKNYQVDKNNPNYTSVDGVLYSKDKTKLISFPAGREGSFEIPTYVESIGFGAFENTSLSSVTFADGINLLTLGWRAFYNAGNISEITLPESLISIDYYAFAGCKNLTTVNFAENNKLKGIYEGAFFGCQRLENITIPDSIVEISEYAFYGCMSLDRLPVSETSGIKGIFDYAFAYTGINDLTIPDGVIDIGNYAFRGALLENVYIPNTNSQVLMIGIGAFEECNNIEEITIPFIGASYEDSEITWFGYIFGAGGYEANSTYVPESLKTVNIHEGITEIPEYAFYYIKSIESISVPHSVMHVGDWAFYFTEAMFELTNEISFESDSFHHAEGLSGHLNVSDEMTEIPSASFWSCDLIGITLPDSITEIGSTAFFWCDRLQYISMSNGLVSIGYEAFMYCRSLTDIVIPDSVTDIGDRAFRPAGLKSITLGKNVTNIGDQAFYNCNYLEKIVNRSSLKLEFGSESYGGVAYYALLIEDSNGNRYYRNNETYSEIETEDGFLFKCQNGKYTLTAYTGDEKTITLPTDINGSSYDIDTFSGVMDTVIIPSGITSISDSAFEYCTLTSIVIPDSVTSIGSRAFFSCENLENVIMSDSITTIGESAFYSCNSLKDIAFPDSVSYIGSYAFASCPFECVVLPKSLRYVNTGLFDGCTFLKSVTIPDGADAIHFGAFQHCEALTSINIPDSVTYIGNCAIKDCYELTGINIPESVTSIGKDAFIGCKNLELSIPSSVTSIGAGAFTNIKKVNFDSNNQYFVVQDGVVYDKNYTRVVSVLLGVTNITLPDSMTSIPDSAFAFCRELISVVIPDGVTHIGYEAFFDCYNLENITIPDSVTSIGDWAFGHCGSLKSINIPSKITEIESGTFFGCDSLRSLDLPEGLERIGSRAFESCYSLISITIPSTVVSIEAGAFEYCESLYEVINHSSLDLVFGDTNHGYLVHYAGVLENSSGTRSYRSDNDGTTYIETKDEFLFKVKDGKYSLLAYIGDEDTITLPKNINGLSYDIYEFRGGVNVIIDGIPNIPNYAFLNSYSLESVIISGSVKNIGYGAFQGCSSLKNITIGKNVEIISGDAFVGTNYYTNESNWNGGCLYIGDCLIEVDKEISSLTLRDGTRLIAEDAFRGCYSLEELTIRGDIDANLSELTNLETLILTSDIAYPLCKYFNYDIPITLSKVIFESGCDVRNKQLFMEISNVTIFVENEKEACPWDEDYPGWNNGNKVLYGGEWHYVNYYDVEGELITTHYYSASEVIKPPYIYSYKDKDISYEFDGWDMDGDGIADSLPATINKNYALRAIVTEREASYTIKYLDKDGKTVLYTYELPYGAEIPVPESPSSKGYSFLGWKQTATKATEDVYIYSAWLHEGGEHKYTSRVVAPTCTENGYTLYTCSICGESYKAETTNAMGHSYGEWTITNAATCTDDGLMRRKCSCGDVQEAIVDCEGHSYVITQKKESTCQSEGTVKYLCSVCGYELTETVPTSSHNYEKTYASKSWLQWLIETLLDILFGYEGDRGYYYKCVDCNRIATVDEKVSDSTSGVLSSCNHVLGDWIVIKEASCNDGYNVKYCINCNGAVEATVTNGRGQHNYDSNSVVVDPTCTEQGYTEHHCINCGYMIFDSYVDALGHNYSTEWTVDAEPACTTPGSKSHHCLVCNSNTDVTEIPSTGHSYSTEWTVDAEPTCTTAGSKSHYCLVCNDRSDVTEIPSTGHSFTKYVSNNDATYTQDGTKTAMCDNCNAKDTITDVGTALGMAKKFRDTVDDLEISESAKLTYIRLRNALEIYSMLTEEEKAEVSDAYATLIKAVEAYNNHAETANSELAEASETSFSAIVTFNLAFLSALWFLLKKKFII